MDLKHPLLNGWPLFWLLSLPLSACVLIVAASGDLSDPAHLSHLIQYAVRWSVPFIYLVVAAPALPALLPGDGPRWVQRNRRYLGLVFAVAMAWQGTFILLVSTLHAAHYYDEIYYLRDELEGTSGYLFLAAMVLTSFRPGRRLLSAAQWKVLHRCGVYFLWAYAFSVYWWNLFYYGNAVAIDYAYYAAGLLAFAARIAAWGRRRASGIATPPTPGARLAGVVLVTAGAIAALTGSLWQSVVTATLTAPAWSATLMLWLPFWPFEPFLPLLAAGAGTFLLSGGFAGAAASVTPRDDNRRQGLRKRRVMRCDSPIAA